MAASPVKFLFGYVLASIALWVVYIFASRLLAWILSRVVGASVGFRVGGWKCLRDIVVTFRKGPIESVSIGEIKVSLRQSLVKLGVGFLSRDPKLQILICDLEVVMRSSNSNKRSHKSKSRKSRTSGRGKWMVAANIARFLSVSVTDMMLKTPDATLEVKELKLDISKDAGMNQNLLVKLQMLPITVQIGEPRAIADETTLSNEGSCVPAVHTSTGSMGRSSSLCCAEFSLSGEFGHNREAGVIVQNVDVNLGDVLANLCQDLLTKRKKASVSTPINEANASTVDAVGVEKWSKQQAMLVALMKCASIFPEKVSFNLPRIDVRYVHQEHDLVVESNIMGIQLKSVKSSSTEDTGDCSRLDVQMELSEIHLFREAGSSVLEIMKVDVVTFIYIPIQPTAPVRAEVDIKLGGTRCNVILARFKPWLRLHYSKKKKMVLGEESSAYEKPQSIESKAIMWTSTVSAPEMTLVLYSISGAPLYHCCSQSSHVFANNISSMGTAVHVELGELNLHTADEYLECSKESLFGIEPNSGSLVHVAKVSLDWGKKDVTSSEENVPRSKLVLSADITGMGIYLSFKRVESLIVTAMSFKTLLKSLSRSSKKTENRGGRGSKSSAKGTQLVKVNLERCSVNFWGDTSLDNLVIEDPKRVNYGSQGGQVVISASADGAPRTASIMSTISSDDKRLRYSVSFDIFHYSLCVNKEKQSTQMELERARSIYQEYLEEHKPCSKVILFDMQNAKFVRRTGGLKEIAVCSLFSATDITLRWEPDVHLSLLELVLRLKLLVHSQKFQENSNESFEPSARNVEQKKEIEPSSVDKHKKKDSIFALDVEMLNISAELGDGVEATAQIQSIFSENARIGLLLEGLMLGLNGSRIFKSSRMQVSRIPCLPSDYSDAASQEGGPWDWVIQGLDIHVCMPYRLQLRAIDDSVEEMLRALKLVATAKSKLIFPAKKENSKHKKSNPAKFGRIRFCIRKLTAYIEEEPMQGWLDEHYHLLKKEACESAVRLSFLDEFISRAKQSPKNEETSDSVNERKFCFDGVKIDLEDSSAVQKLKDEIYKHSFQSYYQACQSLMPSEGSGACREGFQAGFKPSGARTSLLSLSATDFDLTLTAIEGGEAGMVEVVKKLDPVAQEKNIPFSRLYGSNINLNTGNLVAQLRNYTLPLLSAVSGKCEGRVVLAQQATCFQPQILHDVFIGRWRKVCMVRSASGTTPPMKTYSDLPIYFQKGEVSFGVGYEPAFADISYAFTVALRRANLSRKGPGLPQPPKRERSLPWWDDMRNYIHGNITLFFSDSKWTVLATTDPYEKLDKLQLTSGAMEIQQSDGRVYVSAKDFKILLGSLESLIISNSIKIPSGVSGTPFLEAPLFTLEVSMDWGCESGNSMNHYLFAVPNERKPREKVFDPFRSTSLSLCWNFSFRPEKMRSFASIEDASVAGGTCCGPQDKAENAEISPIINLGAHDLVWLIKFWNLNYAPPYKLRTFSRWPRFGVPRVARSGNLSLDKVMTEFMLRVDCTPTCIKHMALDAEDPARGLTFNMSKLKYEICYSRGKQKYTFECRRDTLDLVYQGLDLHTPKAFINEDDYSSVVKVAQLMRKSSQSASVDRLPSEKRNYISGCTEKHRDDGFLLSSDYFTIRKQAPKADPDRLLAWQESGRRNLEMTYVRSEFENGSESDDHTRSDPSDDDGYNVVLADNCQRIFVYGLKLLWTIENRDAVWSFVGGISRVFESPKPSPSRQYARRLHKEEKKQSEAGTLQEGAAKSSLMGQVGDSTKHSEAARRRSSPSHLVTVENPPSFAVVRNENDSEEDGTLHFMVNVIEPQFNLHSEEANGRFLLAAVSGRVLARSFHSVLRVGYEMFEHAIRTDNFAIPETAPELTRKRMEFSVMLEHVQAHVAPTDVDPGAGLQWLPKIRRSSPKVKRTGALLERVFMPCNMYFRYSRHKGGNPDLKVKPLKELAFNSCNITATMTSRQFQVMLDVLTNLLFARLPKPRKSSLSFSADDDEDVEEEADEMVPDGVEEVEFARIELEQKERERKLLLKDIRKVSQYSNGSVDLHMEQEGDLWMISGGRSLLVLGLKKELVNAQRSRKTAASSLRVALQKAAQSRLIEKEKNKGPSYAMRISLQINKVVWSMLVDGKSFAEAEINDMIYDFDRDYEDIGVAHFTTKYFVVRNCLPNAKSDMLLSAWNPPPEWGRMVMLRVDAKQGAPKDGHSLLELFNVEIYPLRIHLTETMYRMMWEYFFPEEDQDSLRRQEVWKVSTTAGLKRVKKGSSAHEVSASSSKSTKESEAASKSSSAAPANNSASQLAIQFDSAQGLKTQPQKSSARGSVPGLRRTSSFDRTWEETVAESVANELVLQVQSSSMPSIDQQDESSKTKSKEAKPVKSGRSSHEEKKVGKTQEEKKSRSRKTMEFHNIKISQVELLVTYEGSRFVVNDLKLLMDTFHRVGFTGTWRRLFSRVKKHIIWGVLKSVTGMQGKKFKDKAHGQRESTDNDFNLSDNEPIGKPDQYPITFTERRNDGAGDGFVTSIRGLFNTQRRKAKAFVLRTMRGEAENDFHVDWSESEAEFSPFARQLTITKAKRLIRRHTKKFRSRGQRGSSSQHRDSLPSSPRETTGFESDSSSGSSPYEDFHE